MFDTIKNFNRQYPVNELLRVEVENICRKFTHNVAVKEMECVCKAMLEHDDYDINHYRITSRDASDASCGIWAVDIFVEHIEQKEGKL